MIHHHSPAEVTRFDRNKLWFLLLLVATASVLWVLNKPEQEAGLTSSQTTPVAQAANKPEPTPKPKPIELAITEQQTDAAIRQINLSGTAPKASTVLVQDDTGQKTTVQTDDNGQWATQLAALRGQRHIDVSVLDTEGKVDTRYPAESYSYVLDPNLNTASLLASSIAGQKLVANGTGVPGEKVAIMLNGEEIGHSIVADDGSWAFEKANDLTWGNHVVQAVSSPFADAKQALKGAPIQTISLLPVFEVKEFETNDSQVIVSGVASPGLRIQATANGTKPVTKLVDDTGAWSITVDDKRVGDRTLDVVALDVNNKSILGKEQRTFNRPYGVLGLQQEVSARGTLMKGLHMPPYNTQLLVDGKPESTLQFANGKNWSYFLSLPEGSHKVQSLAIDADGGVWAKSPVVDVAGIAAGHQFSEAEKVVIKQYFIAQENELREVLKEQLATGHVDMQRMPDDSLRIAIAGDITFGNASAKIKPEGQQILEQVAKLAKQYPKSKIDAIGHTDSRGNIAYNLNLSVRRADSAKATLVGLGVDTSRITALGMGEAMPIATNATKEGQAKNRRCDIVIIASPEADWSK